MSISDTILTIVMTSAVQYKDIMISSLDQQSRWTKNRSDYFTGKNILQRQKRALGYIYPHTLYVGFTVRVRAKLRCQELGLGLGNRLN